VFIRGSFIFLGLRLRCSVFLGVPSVRVMKWNRFENGLAFNALERGKIGYE